MKHFRLSLALAAVLLIAEIFTTTALVARKGDIDNDGTITVSDARLALRFAVKLDKPTEIQKYCADIDGTKRISVADARTILRAAVKLQTIEDETREFTTIPPSTTKEETTKKNTTEEVTAERSSTEKVTEVETTAKVSSTEESTIEESTTVEVTTEKSTTEESTTEEVSSEESTTVEVTTKEVSTEEATTEESTTEEATTEKYITEEATTNESTTDEVTTNESTTEEASTEESTTEEATTEEYTTEEVTTEEITETETTTEVETTEEASTEESTTETVTEVETTTEAETTEPVLHTHEFTEIVADHSLDSRHKICCECGEYMTESCECTEETVPATCTQGECVIYTCTKCGDIRTVTKSNPLGHDTEVLPGCIFAKEALDKNSGMYVREWPICKRCSKAPTDDISLFNDTVNLIKNDFSYITNHRFTKITKTNNTTIADTEKNETIYGAWINCISFTNSDRLPCSQKRISSLTNDDTESFDVEYLKDGIDTVDVLKDYPDAITVDGKEKNITAYKNKIYTEPTIKMTVKIKSESFTVGSTAPDNLYTKYTSDNSYKCAISRITNDLTPLSDAEAFGSDNNFVYVSEQNGITTSITLNDITVGGTVTYYFDYATLTPLFAVYDLQQTTQQVIKVTDGANVIINSPTTKIKQCEQIYIFE